MRLKEALGRVAPQSLVVGTHVEPSDDAGVLDEDVGGAGGLKRRERRRAHRAAARALANSAARVSAERWTYAAVDSGDA